MRRLLHYILLDVKVNVTLVHIRAHTDWDNFQVQLPNDDLFNIIF